MQSTIWVHESLWVPKVKVIHWPWSKSFRFNIFKLLFLNNHWPIEAKFYVESPWHDFGWLCWGLTSQSTIFQSCRDGAIASWVINQYFWGVKCLAQGHNTAAVGLEPRTSRSGVRHSTTEPPRSPPWHEGTKSCSNCSCHMTKRATMPIYDRFI